MNYSPKVMKETLENNNFSFKKKFGQNFIIDKNLISNIVMLSNIDSSTMVIEIGPGAGSLTYELAQVAKNVLCYEIDNTLEDILSNNLMGLDNVEVIYKDILLANIKDDIKKYNYKKLYVVANLPYYITTPIIIKLIEEKIDVDKIVVMVQKEVGDRFKAIPGSKDYGSLSIFLDYYFNVKKILDVSRNVFMPKPNVDSVVIEFTKKQEKSKIKDENVFFKLVRDSFKQKRKTLKNNLRDYDLIKIETILKRYNYDLSIRAEQLSLEIFVEIANNI